MIVNCDKCGAKFQLADDKITDKGTKVRCSKCKAIFTVKKPEDKPASAPSAPVPAPPKAPAPAGAAPGKNQEDPFSDFNFSDDLDFGEKEINVAPKKEEPAKGFLDSVPSAPIPSKPAAPTPADDGGGFDFSDEDFSLSEPEPPPKPAAAPPPPPPPPKAAPPKPPAPKAAVADEFGDFKFDDESFSEPPAPAPAPGGGGGGGAEEWGNVSIGDEDGPVKAKITKAGAEELDDTGFGDFKFDDGSGKDDEIDIDSFKRSEKSKAPVRDDLEASIGDNDGDVEVQRQSAKKVEPVEAPPPPPKPVIKIEKRKGEGGGKGLIILIVAVVIVLGGILGGTAYTNKQGWFTFKDLFTLKFKKLGDIPAVDKWLIENGYREMPLTGAVEIVSDSIKAKQVARDDLGVTLIVVEGQVANKTNKVQSGIKIQAGLKNPNGDIVASASSYCGVAFTDAELMSLGRQEIQDITDTSSGRDMKCMEVAPETVLPFTIVFIDYPAETELKVSSPQVVEFKTLGQ